MILSKDYNKFYEKVAIKLAKKNNIDRLYEVCNKVFPEQWDHIEEDQENNLKNSYGRTFYKHNLNYILNGYGLEKSILLHFPKIIITNSKDQHIITDLYVKIQIRFGKNNFYINLHGIRSSRTIEELENRYVHSHLEGTLDNHFSPFCLGSGPINNYLYTLNKDSSTEDWEYFLHLIKNYVQWESISGEPYKYMRDIGSSEIEAECQSYIPQDILKENKFKNIKYKIRNNKIEVIPTSELEEEIFNVIKDTRYKNYLCCKTSSGKYVKPSQGLPKENFIDLENKVLFTFKGKEVKFKISNKQNIQNYEYNAPNPAITTEICKILSNKLTKAQIKRNSTGQENSIKITKECSTPNPIFV